MLTQKIFATAQFGAEGILYILLALSIISITIILERYFVLRGIKAKSRIMQGKLSDALATNNLEDLVHLSKERESLESRVLSYGIRYAKENGPNGVGEVFNSYSILEKQKLERGLNFLGTIGANGPFIGLLGTVLGIMKAFQDLGASQGNVSVVMSGIAEALVATAVGLFVAIPAVIAYNYFQRQVKTIISGLESVKELCIAYAYQKKQ